LAVYQDGVRLNEPFGDTVNWDLVPTSAVASMNLMPGSNPLFGLNALGGAVSVQTKTGFSHPGHAVNYSGGAFGRQTIEVESGAHTDHLSYFVAGSLLSEDGWRDHSPSRVRQLFGDLEWRRPTTIVNATVTMGANKLIGNSAAPVELLEEDRSAVFTFPDETKANMALFNLRVRHTRSANTSVDGLFFYRGASIDTFNGDDSNYDECEDEAFEEFLCADDGDGYVVEDQFGRFIPVDEDDELDATNNTSGTRTDGWGAAIQLTVTKSLANRPNHFVAGISFDGGGSDYEADTEIARLTEERGTVGTGLLDNNAAVRLRTTVGHTGIYAANFFEAASRLTLMGSARLNVSTVTLRDQLGTDLDGDHSFTRLNPAAGVTYDLVNGSTLFGSVSLSSRVPAPSELSCADPEDPCRLPNAFAADPPLDEVVATTWEGGVRGRHQGISWNASVFRTANQNDIMFISSGPLTNTGHFENVGNTMRNGFELGASGERGAVGWGVAYSFVTARFDTPLTVASPNHPDEEDGEIQVDAGSRIPGVPLHNLKAHLTASLRKLTVGANLVATSSQYLRGDEANLMDPIDGFAVVNLTGAYAFARNVSVTARVTNVFDSQHATFGLLGDPEEVLGDDYQDPRFLSPAPPRAAWIGIELSFR
jgi:outer membrane receptor protein involved in Fe transport